jgi:hypothetical protein
VSLCPQRGSDNRRQQIEEIRRDTLEEALRNSLSANSYIEAMHALGENPIVDI